MNTCELTLRISTHGSDRSRTIGGIFHDPDVFDEPESFKPERYLSSEYGTKNGVDASAFRHTLPFGAGRVSLKVNNEILDLWY
jgi:hypothetical protein